MANGENLSALISSLDARLKGLDGEIQSARKEIEQAEQSIRNHKASESRFIKEAGDLEDRLQALPADQGITRADVERRLHASEAQARQAQDQVSAWQSRLDAMEAEGKEEKAQRGIEQARMDFLIQLRPLLSSIDDGPVRYLFAVAAIEACRTRKMDVAAFSVIAEKETVARILHDLNEARNDASAEDRQEAGRFEELRRLAGELTPAQRSFLEETAETQKEQASLVERQDQLKKEVDQLVDAQKASEAESQKPGGLWGWIKRVPVILGDKVRDLRLSSKKKELESIGSRLQDIGIAAPQRIKDAREKSQRYREDLAKLELGPPIPADPADSSDPFAGVLESARSFLDRWREKHPDVGRLGPPPTGG